MEYLHGIRVSEEKTALQMPVNGTSGLQIVFGTAPVNLAEDPYQATNQLILCQSFAECEKRLGYSDDFKHFTLCQSMDASFKMFHVAPVIFCNVLNPNIHRKTNSPSAYAVKEGKVVVPIKNVLLDTIIVKTGDTALEKDIDYVTAFNKSGSAVIAMLDNGAGNTISTVTVESISIDPEAVTIDDIIGGYDITTGYEKGLELVRLVYPKFGLVPGLLLAPGWSKKQEIGAVLSAKCEQINGMFCCECVIDLDTVKAKKYTDCKAVKEESGLNGNREIVVWPCLSAGGNVYDYSAIYGAMVAYTDANNEDIPNLSPSNYLLKISGAVTEGGTEINLDQIQANTLNEVGIVTAINDSGWKSWGNNTACYPINKDPKDRWICCRRFFSWWGNSFILTYKDKADGLADARLIESICDSENIRGNGLVARGKCAGAKIKYLKKENSIQDILDGKIRFRQYLAPYTPAEDISNVLEFDPSMLEAALGGE